MQGRIHSFECSVVDIGFVLLVSMVVVLHHTNRTINAECFAISSNGKEYRFKDYFSLAIGLSTSWLLLEAASFLFKATLVAHLGPK